MCTFHDLRPAAEPVGDDIGRPARLPTRGQQVLPADCYGNVVMRLFQPEGPCHAAAARLRLLEFESHPSEQVAGGVGIEHRLLMAVGVENQPCPSSRGTSSFRSSMNSLSS